MEYYKILDLADLEGEIWKDIKGYEGLYQCSNMGRFKSIRANKIMKQTITSRSNYLSIHLRKNGYGKCRQSHIWIAETWIPNVENKPEVDHIDTNRLNNQIANLRWCTSSENSLNPITRENKSKASKKMYQDDPTLAKRHSESMLKLYENDPTQRQIRSDASKKMWETRERIVSDETKAKISESRRGIDAWNKGIKLNDEHRRNLSLSHQGKHWKLVDGKRVWY